MRQHEIAKCALRQRFPVRRARLRRSETILAVGGGEPLRAPKKQSARQVLPCGRQKTPSKYLKNKEKTSPGFVLRVVQRIESLAAGGYGMGLESGDELRA
jgi:hypothetical protein